MSISHRDRRLDIPADLRRLESHDLAERVNESGQCRGAADPDAWFPFESKSATSQATYAQTARYLCAGCSVQAECLLLALRAESHPRIAAHGIYGGRSPWQRDRIRRNLRQRGVALKLPTMAVAS